MKPENVKFVPLPAAFTLLNAVFGFVSIIFSMEGRFVEAAYLIIAAVVADGIDGRVARLTRGTSKTGMELDSLADAISFGVAPAILLYSHTILKLEILGLLACSMMVVCGILRLAKFNVLGSHDNFSGMPIPVTGIFAATFVISGYSLSAEMLATAAVLLSYLMVSSIEYPAFKGKVHTGEMWYLIVFVALFGYVMLFARSFLAALPLYYIVLGPLVEKAVHG